MKKSLLRFAIAIGSLFALLPTAGLFGQAASQAPAPSTREATVGETYKNIKALTDLKDAPASELTAAMQHISGSLSVSCNYCHIPPFENDSRKPKQLAREMILMTRAINANHFGGRPVVTCNTCHQGSLIPKATPNPWNKTPEESTAYEQAIAALSNPKPGDAGAALGPAAELPNADQLMSSYRRAVGAQAVNSVHLSGDRTLLVPRKATQPFEIYLEGSDRILISATTQGLKNQQILNRDHGWVVTANTRNALPPDALPGLRDIADLFRAVKYQDSDQPPRTVRAETVAGRKYYIVETHAGKKTRQLWFDAQTALLYKSHVELPSPLGPYVGETFFEDYRDVNGVKFPYLVQSHYMNDELTYRISEVQPNLTIDAVRFEPPAPPERKSVKLDAALLDAYAGRYQLAPGTIATVSHEGDRAFLGLPGRPKLELFAESETNFFVKEAEVQITFVKDETGKVKELRVLQGNANVITMARVP